ncbi:MAG TPA: putative toxin-antitoxin system toxin component, PIN family [Terriglobia bacterium]|nr:putative toxin-antitoxin system toxin component, PIN family [Terriglobia bacterium]
MARDRVVVDNNALISRLLLPESVPGRAVRKAVDKAQLLVSASTLHELAEVLSREKFDRYLSIQDRQQFLRLLTRVAEIIPIIHPIRACRDPKDDMFLEVAVNGEAHLIVTGDRDLLVLSPFRTLPILTPACYLERD